MARFQCILIVLLTVVLPLIQGCTGSFGIVLQPWIPAGVAPILTCSFLCPATQTETYSDARDECLNNSSDLTTINNQQELSNLIANNRNGIWIGLGDFDGDGNFEWADGSDDGFISWAPGFPTSDPNKTCVVVTSNGMENEDCNATHNFLCERGLCQEYGGTCVSRARHCCKRKMNDDIYECSGDAGMICCKSSSGSGGSGGVTTTEEPVTCPPSHQECLCKIRSEYIMASGDQYKPWELFSKGCDDGLPLERQPECGEPEEVCLKHRILNLLKCYNHTCDAQLQLVDVLDHSAYPDGEDFCNGRCVRLVRQNTCPSAPLEQMCHDIMGTYYEEVDVNNEIYITCCI